MRGGPQEGNDLYLNIFTDAKGPPISVNGFRMHAGIGIVINDQWQNFMKVSYTTTT